MEELEVKKRERSKGSWIEMLLGKGPDPELKFEEMSMNKQIKQMRINSGMQQKDLARKLYASQSAVSKFESPGYENFSVHTLKQIAKIFDLNLVVYFEPKGKE